MEQNVLLTYDGSFHGFLSCVYSARERALPVAAIRPAQRDRVSDLFQQHLHVHTHMENAREIWEALGKHGSESQRYIYFAFLSERTDIQFTIFKYINFLINGNVPMWKGHFEFREKLSPWAQRVGSEKRHLEAQTVFRQTDTGIHLAVVKPVYNVLPLLTRYSRNRFKQEPWALYDSQRTYGLRYLNGEVVRFDIGHESDVNGNASLRPVEIESAAPHQEGFTGYSSRRKPLAMRASA